MAPDPEQLIGSLEAYEEIGSGNWLQRERGGVQTAVDFNTLLFVVRLSRPSFPGGS